MAVELPSDVTTYLAELTERLAAALGPRLLGAYSVGSVALGDYRPGRSDLDVLVIVDMPLDRPVALTVAEACSHRRLPCPACKLELVVVSAAVAARPGAAIDWELNLNTGEGLPDHVGLDPAVEPRHWFVLDLALAHQCGVVLHGPDVRELVGTPEREDVRRAQRDVVVWYASGGDEAGAAHAACRAWHWRETGRFASKGRALAWAVQRGRS